MSAPRDCGACTLCCELPEIEAFDKPANEPCTFCVPGKGCQQYAARPELCRDFSCFWLACPTLGPEWAPDVAHMMAYAQGPQITILVDPAHAPQWQAEPYASQLRSWAAGRGPHYDEQGQDHGRQDYVIVFEGDSVFKIDP